MPNYPTLIPKTTTPTPETLPRGGIQLPALFSPDSATAQRVLEFFTANIRNPHTRKAYATAVRGFAAWTDTVGITHLRYIKPLHVAAYIEQLQSRLSAPSVKLQLAAIRMLFDWLVVGQIVPTNPASAVRGPKHSLKKGKTPALTAEEARDLLDSIATRSPVGLRDRALIALMIYTFARVGAVLKPPCPRRRHRDENRLPQLPRHRHHGVFAERGQTRSGAADGQPRIRPHHRALRQTQRPGLARRGREDSDLKSNHWWPRQHFPPAVVGALLDFNEQLVTKLPFVQPAP